MGRECRGPKAKHGKMGCEEDSNGRSGSQSTDEAMA